MSTKNTTSDKSVKVINQAQADDILTCFRTLHGKVLNALQACEIAPLFNTDFSKCVNEDYKNLHQQARALLTAKSAKEWNDYIGAIKEKILVVVDSHQAKARAAKESFDKLPSEMRAYMPAFPSTVKVPVSDLKPCFPQGKSDNDILVELDKLFPRQVAKGANDTFHLSVSFQAEAPKVVKEETKEEKAPESGEAPKSKAA